MGKAILTPILAIMAGLILIGGVWAQRALSAEVFRGIITSVDPEKRGIFVKSQDEERFFQWGPETKVNGPTEGKGDLVPASLKEGMHVTVFYKKAASDRVAERIDVGTVSQKSEGWEPPFTCGAEVC